MTSPTPAERVALRVAEAAAQTPASAYGLPSTIVFALGAAGLLMDPETAVELDEYRRQFPLLTARVAELEELIERRTSLLRDVQKIAQRRTKEANGRRKHGDALKADLDRLTGRVRELEAERHTTNEALTDAVTALHAVEAFADEISGDARADWTLGYRACRNDLREVLAQVRPAPAVGGAAC